MRTQSVVDRAVDRRSGDQGFGSLPVLRLCKYYAAYQHECKTYPTITRTKSNPDSSVVRAADRNPSLSLVPLRWRSKVKRSFCSAVAAMQCSGFTARRPP
ncbi:hypothetical protein Y032_0095g2869 [Ancylostoma ceylanicum]|uniref:Uncharacterized protein n=1 Tax=Ancylostoma ceylanicum TaxID=53326 RepID=A0A016TKS0_9BILA|nr:hypothetical protein Y032_0095g2869 [Ancylostoma ceylanicum]